jgi:insertion element IS1 protein InsB
MFKLNNAQKPHTHNNICRIATLFTRLWRKPQEISQRKFPLPFPHPRLTRRELRIYPPGGTVGIERNNCRRRHRFTRFKRKSIVVPKSLHTVDLTMALFARFHVNGAREDIASFFC